MMITWALGAALLMSTEFLFQPFIWRNFEISDIAPAWLEIARDRIVVALMIALALGLVDGARPGRWNPLFPYIFAVVLGAALGESVLTWVQPEADRQDLVSIIGRVLRWSLVGSATATIAYFWRSGERLTALAEEHRDKAATAQRSQASSQLEMLRRQIEPHFLFNTLATIRRLHETDPVQGQHVLGRLFHYMSSTLGEKADPSSTLGDEVDLVQAYLDVCASRMTGRLTVLVDVEAELRLLDFPPLVLATLAENAIKHGVFPRNGGVITLSATRAGPSLEVVLGDDGVGLSKDGGGGGLGLVNIVERLRLLYGAAGRFQLQPNTPCGVRAVVRVPAERA